MTTVEGNRTIDQDSAEEGFRGGSAASLRSQFFYRLIANPTALIALGFLILVVLLALLAPFITRYGPDAIDPSSLNQNPSPGHWFGTDYLGRDMWSRVLYGARVSLPVGLSVVAIEFGVGVPVGLVAGYVGGAVDSVLMRMIDVELALPGLLLPLGVIAVLGPSLNSTVVALGVGGIPFYARMARGMTLSVQQQPYVEAAHVLGTGHISIVFRHVLRNALDPLVVQATLGLGGAILAASALSYLGVGVQPPTSDWGTLLFHGYEHMFESWSELAFPGMVVSITVLSINLLGDGLTDALNPRIRS